MCESLACSLAQLKKLREFVDPHVRAWIDEMRGSRLPQGKSTAQDAVDCMLA
jgi:hypothetical protein